MKFDVIRAVEACYAGGSDRAWLGGLLDALEPIGAGSGSFGQVYRLRPDGSRVIEVEAAAGAFPVGTLRWLNEESDRFAQSAPPEIARQLWASIAPVEYAMKRAVRIGPPLLGHQRSLLQRLGLSDALGISVGEPGGTTVLLSSGIPEGGARPPARTLRQLARFSAHLGSGLRLRRALHGVSSEEERGRPAAAVLDTARRAVDRVGPEDARGAMRRSDTDEALRLWQGLVDGTWSLVDQCDSGGKRYVLARRNALGVRDPKALTSRQRSVLALAATGHQNKFIGYLLGLSTSAVSSHLAAAQRKLGLASRAELIQRFGPILSA